MKTLASEGLLVLQVSLNATPKNEEIKIFEPPEPSIQERLNFVRKATTQILQR